MNAKPTSRTACERSTRAATAGTAYRGTKASSCDDLRPRPRCRGLPPKPKSSRATRGLAALAACAACASPSHRHAGTDTGDEPPVNDEPLGFVEPASGQLEIPTDRTQDLSLRVVGAEPGTTVLVIDDQPHGLLTANNPEARLVGDALVLSLRGALTPGKHRLRLDRIAKATAYRSSEVAIFVSQTSAPSLEASLGEPLGAATRVRMSSPEGLPALLVQSDTDAGPSLAIHLLRSDLTFDPKPRLRVPLPGLHEPHAFRPPFGAQLLPREGDTLEVRVTFVAGPLGERLDTIVFTVKPDETTPTPLPLRPLLTADDVREGRSAATLIEPLTTGDGVLVSFLRVTSPDRPTPGDRGLAFRAYPPAETTPSGATPSNDAFPIQLLSMRDTRDTSVLGPVLVTLPEAKPRSVAAALVDPAAILEFYGAGLRGPDGVHERGRRAPEARTPGVSWKCRAACDVATIAGALGSRTTAVLADAYLIVTRWNALDPLTPLQPVAPSPGNVDDPPPPATAALASTVIAGVPVFLVPRGDETPLQAVASAGYQTRDVDLEGVFCQSVAAAYLPATTASDAEALASRREAALACISSGELRLGTLRAR